MAGFTTVRDMVEAVVDNGDYFYSQFRKVPNIVSLSGCWYDYSMYPGNPSANYYASSPLEANVLVTTTSNAGIRHGGNVTPKQKYLQKLLLMSTAGPVTYILSDYLMFYPFIDQSVTDQQDMTNNEVLTRYTDGVGVRIMAVNQGAATGGKYFTVTYTNSDGVAGRVTPPIKTAAVSTVSSIVTAQSASVDCAGPFLPLQQGDKGVRSIQSITFSTPDTGLMSLVLVKPLVTLCVYYGTAPSESDFLIDFPSMPRIYDDAFLGLIGMSTTSIATVIGEAHFIWK